jgi:hypothetical protein
MVAAIVLMVIVAVWVAYLGFKDTTCPYKWNFDICKDCPMNKDCTGELK